MIEQLPETVICLEQFRDRPHQTLFTSCAATRTHPTQDRVDPRLPDQATPNSDQHQQGESDQREHPRPCRQVCDACLGKAQHPFRIAESFFAPEPTGVLVGRVPRTPLAIRDQEPDAPLPLAVARSGLSSHKVGAARSRNTRGVPSCAVAHCPATAASATCATRHRV